MGKDRVLESGLATVFKFFGMDDAFQQANAASKDGTVQALSLINPFVGLTLGAFEGLTKSKSVSNPLFRSDAEKKAFKVDEKTWPTDADGLIALGRDYQRMGESFWAMEAFQKAGEVDPDNHDSQLYLGQIYLDQGRGYDAEEEFTGYIKENPKDPEARELRAQANTQILEDVGPNAFDSDELRRKILQDQAMSIALDGDAQEKTLDAMKDELLKTTPDSPEESRQVLEGLNLLAQRYASLSTVAFDDPKDAELVSEELNYLSSRTYSTMEAFCYASPYDDTHARAPLYAGMSALAAGEIDSGKHQLEAIRADFPEADAILTEMADDEKFAKQMTIVDIWETGVAEHKQFDPLGETYDVDVRLIPRVRKLLINGKAETPWKALEIISKGDEYGFKGDEEKRAAQILEIGPGNYFTRGGWSIEHFLAVSSKDHPGKEEVESMLDDMDYWVAGENKAIQYPGRVYSYLEDNTEGEVLDQVKGEHDKLGKERSGFLDFLKNDVSSDGFVLAVGEIACAEFFIGAGALAATATEAKLVEMGVSKGTSTVLAQFARVGTIGGLYTARQLGEESLSKDLDQVFSPKHILKSYGANLVMVGAAEGFSALGKGAGLRISKSMGLIAEDGETLTVNGERLAWGLTHVVGAVGVVGAGVINRVSGLTPSGDGATVSRDLFGYLKYALGGALFHKTFPKEGTGADEADQPEPRAATGAPDLALGRDVPAVRKPAAPAAPLQGDADATVIREVPKGVDVNETALRQFTSQLLVGNNVRAEIKDGADSTANMAGRNDALGADAQNFQKLAGKYETAMSHFDAAADAYKKNPTPENLTEANRIWKSEVDPALGDLKDSPHCRLQEAHAARVGRAQLEIRGLQMELAGLETRANASGRSLHYEVTFKRPDELNLDPADPTGSMKKIPTKDLVTITVTSDNEGELTKAENLLRVKGLLNGPAQVVFRCAPEAAETVILDTRNPGFIEEAIAEANRNAGAAPQRIWTSVAAQGDTVKIQYLDVETMREISVPLLETTPGKTISTTGDSYKLVTLSDGAEAVSFEPRKGEGSVWEAALLVDGLKNTPAGAMLPRVLGIEMSNGQPRLVMEKMTHLDQAGIRSWNDLSEAQKGQLTSTLAPDVVKSLQSSSSFNQPPLEADYLFVGEDGKIRMGLPRRFSDFADAIYGGKIFAPTALQPSDSK